MDELRIVTVSHDEAMEAAVSSNMEYDERVKKLTKFRLVVDAIATSHQPLWTEMKEPIMTAFNKRKKQRTVGIQHIFIQILIPFYHYTTLFIQV